MLVGMALVAVLALGGDATPALDAWPGHVDRDGIVSTAASPSTGRLQASATMDPAEGERIAAAASAPSPAGPMVRRPQAEGAAADFEVLVSRDGLPEAGAVVSLWRDVDSVRVALQAGPPSRCLVTDRGGVARWREPGGRDVVVIAESAGGRAGLCVRRSGGTPARVAIEFGPTHIVGSVHGDRGDPMTGTPVFAFGRSAMGAADDLLHVATVAADGSFTLSGLPERAFEVRCDRGCDRGAERRSVCTLRDRAARVRFGATPGSGRWVGRVVDTNRQPVAGWQWLEFVDGDAGERRELNTDVTGTFDVQLPAGTWHAAVLVRHPPAMPREPTLSVTAFIGAHAHQQDLVLSGSRLLCRLVPSSPTTFVRLAESGVSLHRGDTRLWTRPPFEWNGDWWLQWCGLPAGDYVLRSDSRGPGCVPDLHDGKLLALHAGTPLLQLDLTVR